MNFKGIKKLALLCVALPLLQASACAGTDNEEAKKAPENKPIEKVEAPATKKVEATSKEVKVAAKEEETTVNKAPSGETLPDGIYFEDGKYYDKNDEPTYFVNSKKEWDWLAFNGNRRYHSECHVCHGPNGLGSTFAPALADSLKTMTYDQFREVVTNGRKDKKADGSTSVMPTFGNNKNVMCFIDDLYVYLKARSTNAMAPLPHFKFKKVRKNKDLAEEENDCFDG